MSLFKTLDGCFSVINTIIIGFMFLCVLAFFILVAFVIFATVFSAFCGMVAGILIWIALIYPGLGKFDE